MQNGCDELWTSDDSGTETGNNSSQNLSIPIRQFLLFAIFFQFAYNISNAAITSLLQFLGFFVHSLGVAFQCESLVKAAECFPIGVNTIVVPKETILSNMLFVQNVTQFIHMKAALRREAQVNLFQNAVSI